MSRPRILVVDDDAFIRRPLQYLLERAGFEADVAVDGVECMEKVKDSRPDLICLDVMMPNQDGFVTCEAIRREESLKDVPIILLSAKGQESDRARGIELGADDFLSKPYSPTELITKIRALLERQRKAGSQ